jgi:hypothetical protein
MLFKKNHIAISGLKKPKNSKYKDSLLEWQTQDEVLSINCIVYIPLPLNLNVIFISLS